MVENPTEGQNLLKCIVSLLLLLLMMKMILMIIC